MSVHVGEDDDIYINSIAIWLEKDTLSNTEEILRIVSEKTGVIPEILAEARKYRERKRKSNGNMEKSRRPFLPQIKK